MPQYPPTSTAKRAGSPILDDLPQSSHVQANGARKTRIAHPNTDTWHPVKRDLPADTVCAVNNRTQELMRNWIAMTNETPRSKMDVAKRRPQRFLPDPSRLPPMDRKQPDSVIVTGYKPETSTCICRKPAGDYLRIKCANKYCIVGWYHLRCVGLDLKSLEKLGHRLWACETCASSRDPNIPFPPWIIPATSHKPSPSRTHMSLSRHLEMEEPKETFPGFPKDLGKKQDETHVEADRPAPVQKQPLDTRIVVKVPKTQQIDDFLEGISGDMEEIMMGFSG
ncbi:hypothetical protein K490DRAFT_68282 [Saccharata proteae CBS 121410]|uniref:Zinc finger PHD-type domain-containing protein n=1 Tax=Saccharata proteae CBS 121410 TaxID=1314787 RepID=A0A9P4LV46_9PEZI|nr:hypothetical protein K490DRAFT_68282 [Saccharata proteae CBS 121410]